MTEQIDATDPDDAQPNDQLDRAESEGTADE
jgi:hypothetical protein